VGTYAVIANMILGGEFLVDTPRWISWAIALGLSLIVAFMIKKLDTSKSIITGLVSMAVTGLFFLLVFITTRRYIGAVVPLAAVSFSFLSVTGLNFFTTIREKSFLRSAFSRYLAPSVIEQIIADPSKLNLGGEKREMTAIFTDVQSFSSFSEKFDPADLVKLLNLYLTDMSDIILKNQGTIDKYEGDAIIAFFGAPIHVENHASLACRSAIQMKKTELDLISKIMDPQGPFASSLTDLIEAGKLRRERPVYTRVGINTGDMVVGNMGTPNKMDYTIMGNAVNLAARLEGVNKQYSTSGILISEYTRAKIGDEFILRSLDRVRVVGINTPLRLYELLEIREEASQALIDMTKTWEKAIETYEKRNFTDAVPLFRAVSGRNASDQVAKLYMGRCEQYLKEAPSEDWDGVRNLTEK
jgi:adenylate cyclase